VEKGEKGGGEEAGLIAPMFLVHTNGGGKERKGDRGVGGEKKAGGGKREKGGGILPMPLHRRHPKGGPGRVIRRERRGKGRSAHPSFLLPYQRETRSWGSRGEKMIVESLFLVKGGKRGSTSVKREGTRKRRGGRRSETARFTLFLL